MKTIKKYKDNRLVFYREKADPSYWDSTWDHQDTSSIYAAAKRGSLGYFDELFEKFLPKQGTIIEAGCGLGQLVIALISRGYRVEGVDNAQKTIHSLQQQFPSIPFRVEDVKSLKVADSTYSAYISIGVVEHDEHGPSLFLEEAFRILKKDGIALISVPYINPLRRIKALLGSYYRGPTDLPFYQYAFSKTEFTQYLTSVGFQVIKCAQYGGYKGLVDEFAYINKLFDMPQGWRLRKWVMNSNFLNKVNGHMMMYVAVKR